MVRLHGRRHPGYEHSLPLWGPFLNAAITCISINLCLYIIPICIYSTYIHIYIYREYVCIQRERERRERYHYLPRPPESSPKSHVAQGASFPAGAGKPPGARPLSRLQDAGGGPRVDGPSGAAAAGARHTVDDRHPA